MTFLKKWLIQKWGMAREILMGRGSSPTQKGRRKKKGNRKKFFTKRQIIISLWFRSKLKIKTFFQSCWNSVKNHMETYLRSSLLPHRGEQEVTLADRLQLFFEKHTKDTAYLTLKIIGAIVVIFFVWASVFHIDESVKGIGQIIPSKRLQVISNLEGGIVEAIHVQEGQVVKQGQALLQLDQTTNKAHLEDINKDFYRHTLTIHRLKAQINRTKFKPSEDIQKILPEFTKQEEELYQSSEEKHRKDLAIAEQELESIKHDHQQAETKLKYAKEKLPVLEEQYSITMQLFEKGLYSKLRTLESKRLVLEAKGEISSLNDQLSSLQADIKQAEAKVLKVKSEYDTQNQRELKEAELKLADAASNKSIYEDRLKRQTVASPIDGIIKELHVKTIGGVIKPAENIVTVVPLNDELLAEVKIAPDDIGFVHPELPVMIKVSAYDFTIYGRLNGVVQTISADALQDKEEKNYFKVLIQSDKNYLEKYGKKLYLTPGMQVDVDIQTGKRTVLSFLLKPLLKGLDQSFTER